MPQTAIFWRRTGEACPIVPAFPQGDSASFVTNATFRFLAALGALTLATTSFPGIAQVKGPITLDQFVDRKSSTVRISGRSIVGATVGDHTAPSSTPELALTPSVVKTKANICVETTTIDGTYWSRGQIKWSDIDANRGVIQFRYGSDQVRDGESNYRAAAQRFRGEGLAVLATLRGCDDSGPGNEFVVVNRSGQPVLDRLEVFVNTARSDADLVFYSTARGKVSVRCVPVKSEFQRVAYDAICEVPGPFESRMEMELVLSRFGDPQAPLPFSLLLALPNARS